MSGARVFRLMVAYDGTEFHGWQKQPGLRTVQGELERAAAIVLAQEDIVIHGAGRTDAGVHARGQVASLRAATRLPGKAIGPLLQRQLPRDVRVVESLEAEARFHARHSARGRRYAYRLLEHDDVMLRRFAWYPRRAYPEEGLRRAVAPLVGEHDCSAFEASGSSDVSPVCRIALAHWSRWEGGLQFEIVADHFLYHMVRNLVGTALQAAKDADPASRMAAILASRDRARGAGTAPPQGLCLERVYFEGEEIAA